MRVEEGGDDSWCETHSTTASFGREILTELLILQNSQENIGSTASGSQIQYNSVKHLLPPCKAKEPHYYAVLFSSFVVSLSLSLCLPSHVRRGVSLPVPSPDELVCQYHYWSTQDVRQDERVKGG